MGSVTTASFHFEAVKGFFMQDDPATNPLNFDVTRHNFGLIDREYDTDSAVDGSHKQPWGRFNYHLTSLVKNSPAEVSYKLLYMGRHGQGFHNVAEELYGTKAWDAYWSKLEGDGHLSWADAHLSELGEQQALSAHAFFEGQLAWAEMPAPERYYVSPLYRCLQTANLTFTGLKLPEGQPFSPTIKELAREVLGEHTCDRRSNRTFIHAEFPDWAIEPGFTEQDELWRADHRETEEEQDVRTQQLLDDIFTNDGSACISLTSHSGQIASMLRVLRHRVFPLPTGGLIPVLIKATRVG